MIDGSPTGLACSGRAILDRAGPLTLARSGEVYEILWDGTFLMSSECRESERRLGALARGRTLVGGLGMGFTLRAALDAPGVESVEVVEIAEAVVAWNRGLLAPLAGRPLDDPRATVQIADLGAWLAGERAAGRYDRLLLDVDNGPSWTARPENGALYDDAGVARLRRALRPGGRVAIWSAQPEPALVARLSAGFTRVTTCAVPVTVAGRPSEDYLITAAI